MEKRNQMRLLRDQWTEHASQLTDAELKNKIRQGPVQYFQKYLRHISRSSGERIILGHEIYHYTYLSRNKNGAPCLVSRTGSGATLTIREWRELKACRCRGLRPSGFPGAFRLVRKRLQDHYGAGKEAGSHSMLRRDQPSFDQLAKEGLNVVRLKGGDPLCRVGDRRRPALKEAGISWETVPGITSAVAVPSLRDSCPSRAAGLSDYRSYLNKAVSRTS